MDPVVVIGSGMSGAAVAGELSRRRVPVLVADAGPNSGHTHVATAAATKGWLEPTNDPHFRPWRAAQPARHYGMESGSRLRIGGRSLYWRGIALRLESSALQDWPAEVSFALQNKEYADVEELLIAWTGAPLDAPRNGTETSLLSTLHRLGFVNAAPTPRAVRYFPDGLWAAYSPIDEIDPEQILAEHSLLDVTSQAGILDVVLQCPKGCVQRRASAVVLCCGAVENARLVALLTGHGGPYPIVDHHAQGWLCARPPWFIETNCGEASVLIARDIMGHLNSFIELHWIEGQAVADAWTLGEQLPSLTNSLQFSFPNTSMQLAVEQTQRDEVLANQRSRLKELREALGVRWGGMGDDSNDFSTALRHALSRPGTAFPYHCPLGTIDHEACTLPLGRNLVDLTGQLRDIPRVFVAGPSVFPRPGAANPSLTTLALSRYIASCVCAAVQ